VGEVVEQVIAVEAGAETPDLLFLGRDADDRQRGALK
jgi:hypothetical protein